MFAFLIVLIALIALVLVLVVLVQSGKGGGLAGIAAGGATTQILGARQAPDILEKATWTLATLFIVLCVLTNFAIDRGDDRGSVLEGTQAPVQVDPMPLPGETTPAPAEQPPATDPAPAGDQTPEN